MRRLNPGIKLLTDEISKFIDQKLSLNFWGAGKNFSEEKFHYYICTIEKFPAEVFPYTNFWNEIINECFKFSKKFY